jgi:hypothetical protein
MNNYNPFRIMNNLLNIIYWVQSVWNKFNGVLIVEYINDSYDAKVVKYKQINDGIIHRKWNQ